MQVEYPKPDWTEKFLLLDLFEGLKTTLRELFKPKVTIQYPEERMEPTERFRGMFRFSFDRCIGCKLCVIACPFGSVRYDSVVKSIAKCDTCAGAPQCVAMCPNEALEFVEDAEQTRSRKQVLADKFKTIFEDVN